MLWSKRQRSSGTECGDSSHAERLSATRGRAHTVHDSQLGGCQLRARYPRFNRLEKLVAVAALHLRT
jgi:hypothetical protein